MKKQLLIVDDDMSLSSVISDYLIAQGFNVSLANNVESALNKIKNIKPDMIITDIMMPSIDGYDFIKMLRVDDILFNIPIILLTAKGMTQDRIKGYNLGCNAYLTKPFNPEELLSIIHNLFNNINLWQTLEEQRERNTPSIYNDSILSLLDGLTNRERTILNLVIQGYKNKEIAQYLHVSTRNVEKYVSRLLSKTSTRNRTQLTQIFSSYSAHIIKGE